MGKKLGELALAEAELARRIGQRSGPLTDEERTRINVLGSNLKRAWEAATTTDRDRKELLHVLIEEVNIAVVESTAHVTLRWKECRPAR